MLRRMLPNATSSDLSTPAHGFSYRAIGIGKNRGSFSLSQRTLMKGSGIASCHAARAGKGSMKINREKFLAAAIAVSAASGGCKLMKSEDTAAQATPEQQAAQQGAAAQGAPAVATPAPETPGGSVDTETQNSKVRPGAARTTSPTKEAQLTTSPTKEAITTSPTKEVVTKPPPSPAKETIYKK